MSTDLRHPSVVVREWVLDTLANHGKSRTQLSLATLRALVDEFEAAEWENTFLARRELNANNTIAMQAAVLMSKDVEIARLKAQLAELSNAGNALAFAAVRAAREITS